MARLFIAVWPPAAVLDELQALPRMPLAGARWTTRAQWHVTVRFLGDVDPGVVMAALDGFDAKACQVELGPRPQALSRSVLVVPVTGLDDLAAAAEQATAGIGRPPELRRYRGHLTLARATNGALPRLDVDVSARWRVDEVALVESHFHPAGMRYETLHTWPLA